MARTSTPRSGVASLGASQSPWYLKVLASPALPRLLLAVVVGFLLALLMTEYAPTPDVVITAGEIADRDLRASRDFQVEDGELTAQARKRAMEQVLPVFNHDALLGKSVEERLQRAFAAGRESLASASRPRRGEPLPQKSEAGDSPAQPLAVPGEAFEAELGIDLPEEYIKILVKDGFSGATEETATLLLAMGMRGYVILSKDVLPAEGPLMVRSSEGGTSSERVLKGGTRVEDLGAAREAIALAHLEKLGGRAAAPAEQVARSLAQMLMAPNLAYDASATQVKRDEANLSVQPIQKTWKRGEIIIRSGEVARPWQAEAAAAMWASRSSYQPFTHLLALTCLLTLELSILYTFASRFIRKFAKELRDLFTLSLLLLLAVGMTRAGVSVAAALADHTSGIPEEAWWFALPVAATAMLVRILMNSETALVFSAVACTACGYVLDQSLLMTLYLLVGCLAAAGGLAHANERGKVFRAGLITALVNASMAIALAMVHYSGIGMEPGQGSAIEPLMHVAFGIAGGLVSGVIVLGLVPAFEGLGYLTDIKLLELSSLNHPLLREMIVRAPGTWHHSMVVGQLSEAAAEAISARALLARVGCYFHDIGKILKPQYFIENVRDGENLHDRLSPSMSALIIHNHVKEGMELARRHRLPQPLIDLIPQHHGTSVVAFFYNKARQLEDPSIARVNEADFRYPGPKPRTREAGILMLADGVEAATRSLKEPTSHAIRTRVQKIIEKVVSDGQLDECPLTLRELKIIGDTFTSALQGIHHQRIEYPEPIPRNEGRGLPESALVLEKDAPLAPPKGASSGASTPYPLPGGMTRTLADSSSLPGTQVGRGVVSGEHSLASVESRSLSVTGEGGGAESHLVVVRSTAGVAVGRKKG